MRYLAAAALFLTVFWAGAVSAQGGGGSIVGPDIRHPIPPPTVPDGARQQAEHVIEHDLGDLKHLRFMEVRAIEVASIKHGPFATPIDGPLSVICGRYAAPSDEGAYGPGSWFFVAIKQRHILWTASNEVYAMRDEAYYSCKAAGLTPDSPPQTGPALQ